MKGNGRKKTDCIFFSFSSLLIKEKSTSFFFCSLLFFLNKSKADHCVCVCVCVCVCFYER